MATQCAYDRETQQRRQVVGLVESTMHATPTMQRDRDDRVSAAEDHASSFTHEGSQRMGKRSASSVLECVDDLSKSAVVSSSRADSRNQS